jgi:type I restriction enzyme S subunit
VAQEQVMRLAGLGTLPTSASTAGGRLASGGVGSDGLPNLAPGWHWSRLSQIADLAGGVTKDSSKQTDPSYIEVPYLRVANVQKARLDLSVVTTIRVPPQKAVSLTLQPGDVLLNEGGDRDKLGRGWVWEGQIDGCIHQNHVFRARIRDNATDPYLLSWYANTVGRDWCERNGRQSVNLASISLSRISQMPVPVPPTGVRHELRERTEDALARMHRLATDMTVATRKGNALRQSLLVAAFSGRLIPQVPDDEPAELLIKRIQAERATEVPRTRRTRNAKAAP